MQNFNVTGGFGVRNHTIAGSTAGQVYKSDVRAKNKLVGAIPWEGDWGKRCEFRRRNAHAIPA